MPKTIDLTGQTFGRLSVLKKVRAVRRPRWACVCECGVHVVVAGTSLRGGQTSSCGCLQRDRTSQASITHGQSKTPLYRVWHGMRARCLDAKHKDYRHYGGRGIKPAPEWDAFEAFRDWATKAGYAAGLTIDRIDNDGPYEPANCRWVTLKEQARNKRNNRAVVRSDGRVFQTVAEAKESVGGKWDSAIVAACSGRKPTAYGYRWQYLDEPLNTLRAG